MQIQSITNQAATQLTPPKKSQLAVKVRGEQQDRHADAAFDPHLLNKIELSRNSYKEELALLRARESKKESQRAAIDDLENRLLHMESILYQVAATMAFDADSFEVLQKRIAAELKGTAELIGKVELKELEESGLKHLADNSSSLNLNSPEDVAQLRETVKSASQQVQHLKENAASSAAEKRTGKTLEIAQQNAEAVLTDYDPQAAMEQAKSAAQFLREQNSQLMKAQGNINQQSVIDLLA